MTHDPHPDDYDRAPASASPSPSRLAVRDADVEVAHAAAFALAWTLTGVVTLALGQPTLAVVAFLAGLVLLAAVVYEVHYV